MYKYLNYLLIGVTISFILVGCSDSDKAESTETITNIDTSKVDGSGVSESSFWITYWDDERGYEELELINDNEASLIYFAAYFDSQDQLFIPESLLNLKEKELNYKTYLSFVNDIYLENDDSLLKDKNLLWRILSDEAARGQHEDDVIKLAIDNGFDGIEIDYEGIKDDDQLWQYFALFCNELYRKTEKTNLDLRILFEPSSPVNQLELPEGPRYIMMCYNLYGKHSEPGPKANEVFIRQMIVKMIDVPGQHGFALATGGYDWEEHGEITEVTESDVDRIIARYNPTLYRDKDSRSVYFEYTDAQNVMHEVWYADHTTLKYWKSIVDKAGNYDVSIWRLGGNSL